MRMVRTLVGGWVALACLLCMAADSVEPASISAVWGRSDSVVPVSAVEYYEGTTLRLLTNTCTTTSNTVQGLDGVEVELRLGTQVVTNNVCYTGTVVNASAGTWTLDVALPSMNDPYAQVKLTDTNGASFIYPWKVIKTKEPMQ